MRSLVTQQEFKQFFEALPSRLNSLRANTESPPLTKAHFAQACQLSVTYLKEIGDGHRPLNKATIDKVLPVMRRYGFQG